MKKKQRYFLFGGCVLALMLAAMAISCSSGSNGTADAAEKNRRNVIFMVPDGMGLSNVTIARIYKNGPNGDSLHLEKLPYTGYQRTHSRNSTVTDSAAAGSAWASGEKFNNGEISCLDDNGDGICDGTRINPQTILEIAQEAGMAAGLVATSDITHATPAVWGSHVHNRKCESEIFRQFLERDIDVLMGGGIATNRGSCLLGETDDAYNETLIQQAIDQGYTYVRDKNEMTLAGAPDKMLGLFQYGGLTPVYSRSADSAEPTLAEMTRKALEIMEAKETGFFLMIEGSQIDWADHARDVKYQIGETLDFDNAVKIVWDWINADETRKENTLLIVVPDHETGGVIIDGPYGSLSHAGDTDEQLVVSVGGSYGSDDPSTIEGVAVFDEDGNPVMAPDLTVLFGSNPDNPTSSANHTAVDTLIWSNSPECARAMDNTELYTVMKNFISG